MVERSSNLGILASSGENAYQRIGDRIGKNLDARLAYMLRGDIRCVEDRGRILAERRQLVRQKREWCNFVWLLQSA